MWTTVYSRSRDEYITLDLLSQLQFNEDHAYFLGGGADKDLCALRNGDDADSLYRLSQARALYSKNKDLSLAGYSDQSRRKACEASFIEAENRCFRTNQRFSPFAPAQMGRFDNILYVCQRKIASVLGSLPSPEALDFSFGPGATVSCGARDASVQRKLSPAQSCSGSLYPYLPFFSRTVPEWFKSLTISESPSKFGTVPKNYKTDRGICVEPSLNAFFQGAVGRYIRNRLYRVGVNLRDGKTINQRLARKGSIDQSIATIDLSMASDTIAYNLVAHLLPLDWFRLLDVLRSDTAIFEGKNLILEKFSSMGNGFTFELETLIFHCLGLACAETIGVYEKHLHHTVGDDIIVPACVGPLLIEVLEYCGFVVNTDKSFLKGNFRESCGGDYHKGNSVRPWFKKESFSSRTLYGLHNWCFREGRSLEVESSIHRDHEFLYGPDGYGDGHLVVSNPFPYLYRTRKLIRGGYGGFFFDTYTLKPRHYVENLPNDRFVPAYTAYVRASVDDPFDITVRRGHKGYFKSRDRKSVV